MAGRKAKRSRLRGRLRAEIIPAILTAFSLAVLLLFLDTLHIGLLGGTGSTGIIFASFAASAFVMFMMPRTRAASPKRFVMSYVIGAVIGYLGHLALPVLGLYITVLVVMSIVSFLLVALGALHPPGAAIAFAFVLFDVGLSGVLVVVAGVILLLAVRLFLEKAVYIVEKDVGKLERSLD